jgi:hypothetical protein
MGNKLYKNLIGIFALLVAGFVLSGCTSQQPAPVPVVCGTDLYTCQDGTQVARNPNNGCQFAACPPLPACTEEAKLCSDGSYVSRNSSRNCEFNACPAPVACTQEAKLCSDGSYVGRNSSRNCAFDACPIVIQNNTNQTLAAEGEVCAGAAGIRCQSGLQCIISASSGSETTCTVPAPPTNELNQCPGERYTVCTGEITPVCGKAVTGQASFRDYLNPCMACSTDSNAIGYYMGTCENQ